MKVRNFSSSPKVKVQPALIALSAFLLLWLVLPKNAFSQTTQAFEDYGVGPRDAAMGNAYSAVADDFSAAFYNPAGLSQIQGTHFTFGYKYLAPQVYEKLGNYPKDYFTDFSDTQWGLIGIGTDLNMSGIINPKYTDRFSFGFAFAVCDLLHSFTNYYDTKTPYYFRYQDRPVALLSAYIGFGLRITDWFSFGGGIVLAPSVTYADTRVYTDVYLPEGEFDSSQGIVNRAYSVVEPILGILFKVPIAGEPDRLRIGLTWRDEVKVIDGEGPALNRLVLHVPNSDQTLEPVPPQEVPVKTMSGYTPMQVALGLSYKPYKGALIAADTIWKDWSSWSNYFYETPDPPFVDTVQERLGMEQRFFTDASWLEYWALRGGWYFDPSPVPNQDNEWNILDNDKHVFTTGFGLRLDRILGIVKTPVNLDGNFQAHYLVPKTIENDEDPSFGKIETSGMVYSFTVAVEFAW